MQLKTTKAVSRRGIKARPISVHFPLPKAAATRLRSLAIGRDPRLLNLGVLAVQIRDDESIVLGIELEKSKKKERSFARKTPGVKIPVPAQSHAEGPKSRPDSDSAVTATPNYSGVKESVCVEYYDHRTGILSKRSETPKLGTKKPQPNTASKQRVKETIRRGRPQAHVSKMSENPVMNASVGASTWEMVYSNIGLPGEHHPLKRPSSSDLTQEAPFTTKGLSSDSRSRPDSKRARKLGTSPLITSPVYSEDEGSSVSSSPCSHSPMNPEEVLNLFIDTNFSATSVLRQMAESHVENKGSNQDKSSPKSEDNKDSRRQIPSNNVEKSKTGNTSASIIGSGNPDHIFGLGTQSNILFSSQQDCLSATGTVASTSVTTATGQLEKNPVVISHVATNMLTTFSQLHNTNTSKIKSKIKMISRKGKSSSAVSSTQSSCISSTLTPERTRCFAEHGFYDQVNFKTTRNSSNIVANTVLSQNANSLQSAVDFRATKTKKRRSFANIGQHIATESSSSPLFSSVTAPKKTRSFAQLGIFPGSHKNGNGNNLHSSVKSSKSQLLNSPVQLNMSSNTSTVSTPMNFPQLGYYHTGNVNSSILVNDVSHPITTTAPVEPATSSRDTLLSYGQLGYYTVAGSSNIPKMTRGTKSTCTSLNHPDKLPTILAETTPGIISAHPETGASISTNTVKQGNSPKCKPIIQKENGSKATSDSCMGVYSDKVFEPTTGIPAFPETAVLPNKCAQLGNADFAKVPHIAASGQTSSARTGNVPFTTTLSQNCTQLGYFASRNTESTTSTGMVGDSSGLEGQQATTTIVSSTSSSSVPTSFTELGLNAVTDGNNNMQGKGPQYALSYVYPMGTIWYPYVAVTPYGMLGNNVSGKPQENETEGKNNETSTEEEEPKDNVSMATNMLGTGVNPTQYIDLASSLRYWQQLSFLYKSRMQLSANTNIPNTLATNPLGGNSVAGTGAPSLTTPTFSTAQDGPSVPTPTTSKITPMDSQEMVSTIQTPSHSTLASQRPKVSSAAATNTCSFSRVDGEDTRDKNFENMSTGMVDDISELTSSPLADLNYNNMSKAECMANSSDISPPFTFMSTLQDQYSTTLKKQLAPSTVSSFLQPEALSKMVLDVVPEVTKERRVGVEDFPSTLSPESEGTVVASAQESMQYEESRLIEMKKEVLSDSEDDLTAEDPEVKGCPEPTEKYCEWRKSNSVTEENSSGKFDYSPTPELSFVHESSIACVNVGNNNGHASLGIKNTGNGKDGKVNPAKRKKSKKSI